MAVGEGVIVPGGSLPLLVLHSPPGLRFRSPLIEPDVGILRIRFFGRDHAFARGRLNGDQRMSTRKQELIEKFVEGGINEQHAEVLAVAIAEPGVDTKGPGHVQADAVSKADMWKMAATVIGLSVSVSAAFVGVIVAILVLIFNVVIDDARSSARDLEERVDSVVERIQAIETESGMGVPAEDTP